MVLAPILLIAGLGVALFIFKDKIASFVSGGLTDVGTNLDKFGKEQQKAFDDFVTQTQQGIDKTLTDINQAGIDAQGNVNQFFVDAQSRFDANLAGIDMGIKDVQTNIDTGVQDVQKNIDQFGKDVQTNIRKSVEGTQKGFEDFFNPIFGGQKGTKDIPIKKSRTMISRRKPLENNLPTKANMDSPIKTQQIIAKQKSLDTTKTIISEQPNVNLVSKFIKPKVTEPLPIKRATRFSR